MGDKQKPPSLENLGERLRAARQHQGVDTQQNHETSGTSPGMGGFGWALRIGVEMVSALIVGVGIGYGLDWWLGTKPWFLVVFFLLGAGAAILNVYRAAMGYGLAVGYRKPDEQEQEEAARDQDSGAAGKPDSPGGSGGAEGDR
jgi:ATP synthase protein I